MAPPEGYNPAMMAMMHQMAAQQISAANVAAIASANAAAANAAANAATAALAAALSNHTPGKGSGAVVHADVGSRSYSKLTQVEVSSMLVSRSPC